MTFRLFHFPGGCTDIVRRTFACVLLTGAMFPGYLAAQVPAITTQPRSGVAGFGETFGFSVVATGASPLSYQWRLDGSAITVETNSQILIANATNVNAGSYTVVVSNPAGSITSQVATLTLSSVPRAVLAGTVTAGAGRTTVPVLLSANGRENTVRFTLGYRTDVLGNPTFVASVTNQASGLDVSRTNEGLVNAFVELADGVTFNPGRQEVGRLEFDLLSGTNPFSAGLYFTNASLVFTNLCMDTNNQALVLGGFVPPQIEPVALAPALNRQSGLFEHQVRVDYAGAVALTNVNLVVSGLDVDSLTNIIRLYNAIGTRSVDPDNDGAFELAPYVAAGRYDPGQTRLLTLEYYVADKVTVPSPEYLLEAGDAVPTQVPASAIPLNITTNRYVNGTFIIQFPTRRNYRYFVQYGPTLNDVVNTTTNARVVNPGVNGTGYEVQWIDNGPPKTESPPVEGMRFYRLLEVSID